MPLESTRDAAAAGAATAAAVAGTATVTSVKDSGLVSNAAVGAVMEVMAAKTGYDVEMIEEEMDMEVELGIDSIKRVEILSEVQKRLGIEVQNVAALSRTKTVGDVIGAMGMELGGVQQGGGEGVGESKAAAVAGAARAGTGGVPSADVLLALAAGLYLVRRSLTFPRRKPLR